MDNEEKYKKISIECALCKTKFELWIEISKFSPELEKYIRENFYLFCPVCKALKELERKQEQV